MGERELHARLGRALLETVLFRPACPCLITMQDLLEKSKSFWRGTVEPFAHALSAVCPSLEPHARAIASVASAAKAPAPSGGPRGPSSHASAHGRGARPPGSGEGREGRGSPKPDVSGGEGSGLSGGVTEGGSRAIEAQGSPRAVRDAIQTTESAGFHAL